VSGVGRMMVVSFFLLIHDYVPLIYSPNIVHCFLLFKIEPRGAGGSGGEIFENDQSDAVTDSEKAKKMWDLSEKIVGLSEK